MFRSYVKTTRTRKVRCGTFLRRKHQIDIYAITPFYITIGTLIFTLQKKKVLGIMSEKEYFAIMINCIARYGEIVNLVKGLMAK